MAVASPVLERNADTEEREFTREYKDTFMTAEERHNSRISANYAKLINPESKLMDIIVKEPVRHVEEVNVAAPVQEVQTQKPYLVENARADADIFRADSPINRRLFETAGTVAEAHQAVETAKVEEEENEDLRPTMTTIQYKTEGVKTTTVEEGKIEIKPVAVKRQSILTKKDKIIIAVALSVIVALFVLIIVNSVVISNLSSEVSTLQSTLSTVETTYEETLAAKDAYLEESNLYQVVSEFANGNGMVLR